MKFFSAFLIQHGPVETAAQVIGFFAMTLLVASFQQKTRTRILGVQMVSGTLWTLHYALLGAYTGMALNFVGVVRCFVYANRKDGNRLDKNYVPVVFLVISIATGLLAWTSPASLLPMASLSLTSFTYWSKNPTVLRVTSYPNCICWLIFNILSGSYAGVATEVFNLVSVTVGILRHDVFKKEKKPVALAEETPA